MSPWEGKLYKCKLVTYLYFDFAFAAIRLMYVWKVLAAMRCCHVVMV